MKICGNDGEELRCCKTGMTMHDTNYHPDSRFQADLFFCPACHKLHIERVNQDYFDDLVATQLTITHDPDNPMIWDPEFMESILNQYGVDLLFTKHN